MCIVSNSAGKVTSKEVVLRVNKKIIAPKITRQPENITVNENEEAKFSVTAEGTSLGYQWKKNGKIIREATGTTYTISTTTVDDDQNRFSCVISNIKGSVISDPATLTLLYSVFYNGNGDGVTNVPSDSKTYAKDTPVIIPSSKPKRDGHTFLGWSTLKNGSVEYGSGETYTMKKGRVTFYAVWEEKQNTITFKFDFPGKNDEIKIVKYGESVKDSDIPRPERDNHIFMGWFINGNKSNPFSSSYIIKSNIEVIADWDEMPEITITLLNGNVDKEEIKVKPEDGDIALPTPSKPNATFNGWYINQNCTGTPVTQLKSGTISEDMTLYGCWSISVQFDLNGEGATGKPPYKIIRTPATSLGQLPREPTRLGYHFNGWYLNSKGDGEEITETTPLSTNTTLYAQWIIKDIDGNVYNEVKIGNQVWMAQNLKTTKYNDGSAIEVKDIKYPGESESNKEKYGLLYYKSSRIENLAPAGWRIPTKGDFEMLKEYLISNGFNYGGIDTAIAKSLVSNTDWVFSPVFGAPGYGLQDNNKSGFNALPAGRFDTYGGKIELGEGCFFWTSSCERIRGWPIYCGITNTANSLGYGTAYKVNFWNSIRLIRE
jgi:uncharacterized protein (TIGR02145 family)/uncharacterized repeat protein (TIGR02543 family)